MGANHSSDPDGSHMSDSDFLLLQTHVEPIPDHEDASPSRLNRMEARIAALERTLMLALKEMRDNTKITRENSKVVCEIRDYQVAGRLARRVIGWAAGSLLTGAMLWNQFKDLLPSFFPQGKP